MTKKISHGRLISTILGTAFIAFAVWIHWFANFEQNKNNSNVAVHVEAVKATKRDMPYVLKLVATTEAYNTVEIRPLVGGQVIKINFEDGQNIKADDLLFEIDSRGFENQLKQAEANLLRDQAQLENAENEEKRYRNLFSQKAISEEQYLQILTNLNVLKATVESDKAAIDNARLQIEYSKIRAPIDGKAGETSLSEGDIAEVSALEPLVTINQISPIYVTFSVPAKYLNTIRDSQSKGDLSLTLQTSAEEDIKDGRVVFIDNMVDSTSDTIKLKSLFPNSSETLWPGEFVKVFLTLYTKKGSIIIPTQALQMNINGAFVFTIDQNNKANIQSVKVDFADDNYAVISDGLKEGELVVTKGQLYLTDGKIVAPIVKDEY